MKYYYYLFYKIYVFSKKIGKWDIATSAALGLSFLLILNVFLILTNIFGFSPEIKYYYEIAFLIAGIVLLINYFLFDYKSRYKKVINAFKVESEQSRVVGNILVTIYVIATLISVFFINPN